jgi:hypothetical protein
MDDNNELMNDNQTNEAAKKIAEDTFSDWLGELETKDQPEACSIDNPDCENCGS